MKAREYSQAISSYEQAVAADAGFEAAGKNLKLARHILDYLENLREQTDTGDETELGADEIKFDNKKKKGKEIVITDASRLEAESAEQWMRSVDTRMRDFLRTRFAVERGRRRAP